MCGIAGFWNTEATCDRDTLAQQGQRMATALTHRGPDSSGTWADPEAGLALSHRRLAIVDLSPEGHQPMLSADGRYVLSFNGEIYNFLDLKQQLEALGHKFRGRSDTEVMLASICQWGVPAAVTRFTGMFAFALWDRQERVLQLGRDRLGEKPLYYGWQGSTLLFGSELKALRQHPAWQGQINRDAIALLLRHNYIPAPHSIFQTIYKLPPATLLRLPHPQARDEQPVAYWSLKVVAEAGTQQPFTGTAREAADQLDQHLRFAVRRQMIADVPLGAFLSGGLDSSTVVALMQAESSQPVKTFTIGFHEQAYNEAEAAKAVAQHLDTEHTEWYVTPADALAVIPKLPALYDEPFSDSSQIPTFLVSQLARQHVTVSLSGDGGDELFGGYNRYLWDRQWRQPLAWLPSPLRSLAAGAIRGRSPQAWQQTFDHLRPLLPPRLRRPQVGDKLHKLAEMLELSQPEAMYRRLVSHWAEPETIALGSQEPATALNNPALWAHLPDFTQRMMYLDAITYLPGDILTKVDRAAMAVSLETRIPFLDRQLVEFAWSLPLDFKLRRDGQGKWLLRQVLGRYVPPTLFERPKMGFGVPIDQWLRGPLRDWAESLLSPHRLQQQGWFAAEPIRQKWQEHLAGKNNWQYYLWDVLMFQAWLDSLDSSKPTPT